MTSRHSAQRADISVRLLADHPETIDDLERWFIREWEPYYGADGPGDARKDLSECSQRNEIPLAVIAFCDGVLCGTAALRPTSVTTHPDFTPWIAALLVSSEHRGRGVGARLVQEIEALAAGLGFKELYVGASAPDSDERRGGDPQFYLERGWELIDTVPYFVGDAAILRRSL